MKTTLTAMAVVLGLITASLPASAGYTSPNASWSDKAFTNGIP